MKQEQIYEERNDEKEIEKDDFNYKNFLKKAKDQQERVIIATEIIKQQDKRLVGINEKLDDYKQEVSTINKELMDIVDKGIFGSIYDGIKGLFSKNTSDNLSNDEKQILTNAKNNQMKIDNDIDEEEEKKDTKKNNKDINNYEFKEVNDWQIIKEKKNFENFNNEEEAIEEAIKMYKETVNNARYLNETIEDSKKVIDITNKNFDKSSELCKEGIERMKKHK